jgi:hypothetical protein
MRYFIIACVLITGCATPEEPKPVDSPYRPRIQYFEDPWAREYF